MTTHAALAAAEHPHAAVLTTAVLTAAGAAAGGGATVLTRERGRRPGPAPSCVPRLPAPVPPPRGRACRAAAGPSRG
ncbi:hypothetical protein, partial [Actinomadura sediminis]